MRIADSYSVIVIPKDKAKIRRWVVSRERILGTLAVALCFVLFTAAISLGLLHYHEEFVATQDLREKGKRYEKERIQVFEKLSELESVVQQNEEFAGKLESVLGLHPEKGIQVGQGGREEVLDSSLKLAALLPDKGSQTDLFDETSLKTYNLKTLDLVGEAKDIGHRLYEIYNFNPDAGYFWTAIPTTLPLNGWVTSDFGVRRSPMTGLRQFHEGVDIASPYGSPVTATGDGVVTFAGHNGGLGQKLVVDHGYGIATVYGHNSQLLVSAGDHVSRGQVIARVGSTGRSTGPHLHYEVLVNNVPVNPRRFILEPLY